MKVLFKKSDAAEPFSFRFTDDEGKVFLKSENYKARPSALNGIRSVQKNASSEKRYELKTAKNGKAYFNLKATNGQIIGTSPMFEDEQARSAAIALLSSSAASAEIDDLSKTPSAGKPDTSKPKRAVANAKKVVKRDESVKGEADRGSHKDEKKSQGSTIVDKVNAEAKSSETTEPTLSTASQKSSDASSDVLMTDIAEEQLDATTETIVSALNTLNTQIEQARESGSLRGREIVKGLGGDSKMMSLIEDLAGYMGEAASAGVTIGSTPMIVLAGTAKGIYKKITD